MKQTTKTAIITALVCALGFFIWYRYLQTNLTNDCTPPQPEFTVTNDGVTIKPNAPDDVTGVRVAVFNNLTDAVVLPSQTIEPNQDITVSANLDSVQLRVELNYESSKNTYCPNISVIGKMDGGPIVDVIVQVNESRCGQFPKDLNTVPATPIIFPTTAIKYFRVVCGSDTTEFTLSYDSTTGKLQMSPCKLPPNWTTNDPGMPLSIMDATPAERINISATWNSIGQLAVTISAPGCTITTDP